MAEGESLPDGEKELTLEIKNPALIATLAILVLLLVAELQVTFGTPIAFGDEGYYTRMAQWIGENLEYPKWIMFRSTALTKRAYTRPPLWDMLQASFVMIFGFSEALVKFFTPFIALLAGLASFLLIRRLYNERIGLMAAVMLAMIPSFIIYAVTFYTDALETLYLTMFFFLFIIGLKEDKMKYLLAAVCIAALAYFTKKTGFISLIFILFGFVYEMRKAKQPFWQLFKKYAVLIGIPLLLSSSLIVRTFALYGVPCDVPMFELPVFKFMYPSEYGCDEVSFKEQYQYSGRVAETGTEKGVLDLGLLSYLDFAYGNVWLVIFGACAGAFVFIARRDDVDVLMLAALLLYVLILYRSTGRSEDTARFALPWAPIICLLAASYFDEMYKFIRSYQRHIAVVLFVIVIFASYQNFSSKIGVMAEVKEFYPSFFVACDWIKSNTQKDALVSTLWVYRASYCTQRSVAASSADLTQSNDVDHILNVTKQLGITYIWVNKFSIDPLNRHYSEMYDLSYVQLLESHPEYFEKVYETGSPMSECTQTVCDGNIIYKITWDAQVVEQPS